MLPAAVQGEQWLLLLFLVSTRRRLGEWQEDLLRATKGGAEFSSAVEADLKLGPRQPPSNLEFLGAENCCLKVGQLPCKNYPQVPLPSQHTAMFVGTLAFPQDEQKAPPFGISVYGGSYFSNGKPCHRCR